MFRCRSRWQRKTWLTERPSPIHFWRSTKMTYFWSEKKMDHLQQQNAQEREPLAIHRIPSWRIETPTINESWQHRLHTAIITQQKATVLCIIWQSLVPVSAKHLQRKISEIPSVVSSIKFRCLPQKRRIRGSQKWEMVFSPNRSSPSASGSGFRTLNPLTSIPFLSQKTIKRDRYLCANNLEIWNYISATEAVPQVWVVD